MNGVGTISQRW